MRGGAGLRFRFTDHFAMMPEVDVMTDVAGKTDLALASYGLAFQWHAVPGP